MIFQALVMKHLKSLREQQNSRQPFHEAWPQGQASMFFMRQCNDLRRRFKNK